jgi:hypothetical protein
MHSEPRSAYPIRDALDLIAQRTRLSLVAAIEQWRFGRSVPLAEYVIDRNPDLAARLLGYVSVSATLTLGMRRDAQSCGEGEPPMARSQPLPRPTRSSAPTASLSTERCWATARLSVSAGLPLVINKL